MARPYDRTRRAAAAAETTARIIDAAEAAIREGAPGSLTLATVAAKAGVTVQTVLRHFGSRDGCLVAVRAQVVARIEAQRGRSAPGDVDGALQDLVAHYEAEGELVLQLVAYASADPWALAAVRDGQAYHRAWVLRCFGPRLPSPPPDAAVDALVAATDLRVWQLLRLDLGRDPAEVAAVMRRLVHGVLEAP